MTVDPRPGAESPDGAVPADWPTDPGPYRHHDAPVRRSIPGIGQTRAYWVDETTLAWPVDLLPHGVTPSMCVGPGGGPPRSAPPVSFGLVVSPDGQVRVENGMLHRGSRGFELSLVLTGEVAPEVVAAHPQLAGYLALTTADEFGAPRLGREDVEALLTGQLAVVQRTTVASGGWLTAFTGVQIWPVIDRFWGRAASARDGSAPLGVRFVEVAGAEPGDAGGAAGPDGAAGANGTGEELDSEVAALLGASLRPVTPPAGIRSALLEAIAREPQMDPVAGAVIAASAVAAGQVDVEQDDVGPQGVDGGDGALDVVGLGDDVQVGGVGGQLGAHPGADQGVVVDDQDPQGRARRGWRTVV